MSKHVSPADLSKISSTTTKPSISTHEAVVEQPPLSNERKIVSHDLKEVTNSGSKRWARVQLRAYELAERRGFGVGAELSDWLQAEHEIDTEESAATSETGQ